MLNLFRGLIVSIAIWALTFAPAIAQSTGGGTQVWGSFTPTARAPDSSVTNSSSRIVLGAKGPVAWVCNIGTTNTAYVKLGNGSVVASASADFPIPAGWCAALNAVGALDLASITASSTTTLQTVIGAGWPMTAPAGSGGGGGSVTQGTVPWVVTDAALTNATQKSQIVDGSGNVIASTSNNLNVQCANCTGSGASAVDEASFTAGASVFAPGGGFFQTTATNNALTNGQQGLVQMTAQRALFANLRNASGVEIGTAAAPVQVSVANTGANGTALKVDGSAVTQPVSGTFWQATQPVSGTFWQATQPISGTITANAGTNLNTSALALDASVATTNTRLTTINTTLGSPFQAGASIGNTAFTANAGTNLNTSLLALESGGNLATLAAAIISQEATTSGVKGATVFGAVTTTKPTYTTGKSDALSLDVNGLLRVSLADTPANANKFLVTPDSVALPANQSVNVSQINGVTPLMGNGATGTGSPRVTIASDNTAFSVNAAISAASGVAVDGWDATQGAKADAACGTDNGTCTLSALIKRINQNLTTLNTTSGASLPAGTALVGKFGLDQTTLGTTNGVAIVGVNAATALAGNGVTGTGSQRVTIASDNTPFATKVDQTTPGTTNGVALVGVNSATALAGAGAVGTGSARVAVGQDTTTIAGSAPGTAGTPSANVLTVQGATSMTKLLVTPDSVALPANQSVNIAQIAGTTTPVGSGVQATAMRTTLATDSPGLITLGGATPANSVPVVPAGYTYSHISTATTTTVKSGAGVLHTITVNGLGTVASSTTVYDNTAASGTVIAIINTLAGQTSYIYDIAFGTGLTLVTTGTVAPDITVSYR